MKFFTIFLSLLAQFTLAGSITHAGTVEPIYVLPFSDHENGSIDDWLRSKGFLFEQDAKSRDKIEFRTDQRGLIIDAKNHALGVVPNESVNLSEFTYIEIDWGINIHPNGASYEQGIRNEAIMVVTFMGDERLDSGSFFIPDSPYFVGLFLCSGDDKTNHPYIGAYFQKGGRYVCTDRPKPGEMITSRFNLLEAYRIYFDAEGDDDPGISGLAIALDTKKAKGSGKSSAFINEIRFYR